MSRPRQIDDGPTLRMDGRQGDRLFAVTLGGDRTLGDPLGLQAGETYTLLVTQDRNGGHVLGFGPAFIVGAVPPAVDVTANAVDVLEFMSPDGVRLVPKAAPRLTGGQTGQAVSKAQLDASCGGAGAATNAATARATLGILSAGLHDASEFAAAAHAAQHAAGGEDPVTVTQAQVTGLPTALSGEATARAAGDATNATAITAGDATNATAIASEATARAAADTTLTNSLASEATTRAAGDGVPGVGRIADADATLTWAVSKNFQRGITPLTADRAITLAGGVDGARFVVVRDAAATGAFSYNVGGGLKLLSNPDTWAEVAYDGTASAWFLLRDGTL